MTVAQRHSSPYFFFQFLLNVKTLPSFLSLFQSDAKNLCKNFDCLPIAESPEKNFSKSSSKSLMGGMENDDLPRSHHRTRKVFLFANYILLGAASSCIFLVLSLRLIPSLFGFLLILLHLLTIAGAISGCAAASQGTSRWYGTHMVATVLTAIFQGSVSMLIFTRADDFLHQLRSYVREGDGVVILKLAGGLCVVIFCLEWVVLTLAFFLKYYEVVEGGGCASAMKRGDKLQEEQMGNHPFKV